MSTPNPRPRLIDALPASKPPNLTGGTRRCANPPHAQARVHRRSKGRWSVRRGVEDPRPGRRATPGRIELPEARRTWKRLGHASNAGGNYNKVTKKSAASSRPRIAAAGHKTSHQILFEPKTGGRPAQPSHFRRGEHFAMQCLRDGLAVVLLAFIIFDSRRPPVHARKP